MISKKGGNAPRATDLRVEKKQILRKPLFCTWEHNNNTTEQTTDSLCVCVVVGELYLGLIHVSCVTSNFSY
jgi:hypothetical protein